MCQILLCCMFLVPESSGGQLAAGETSQFEQRYSVEVELPKSKHVMISDPWPTFANIMSYSTLRRSRTYIVVPRDVDPQNFIYVPETRKVRNVGWAKCFYIPLLIFLIVGGVLGVAGYFLHQYSQGEGLLEWPAGTLIGKSGKKRSLHQWCLSC